MARRLRLPSWVDDKPEAKPLAPLRHRISRVEKEFDSLDDLERELYSPRSNISDDEREHLARILDVKRERLNKRRMSELGETGSPAPGKPEKRSKVAHRPFKGHSTRQPTPGYVWGIIVFIILLAIVK